MDSHDEWHAMNHKLGAVGHLISREDVICKTCGAKRLMSLLGKQIAFNCLIGPERCFPHPIIAEDD